MSWRTVEEEGDRRALVFRVKYAQHLDSSDLVTVPQPVSPVCTILRVAAEGEKGGKTGARGRERAAERAV